MTAQRKETMLKVLRVICNTGGEGAGAKEIAAGAGLKKSPYLEELLRQLKKGGLIIRTVNPESPSKGWLYKATRTALDSMVAKE